MKLRQVKRRLKIRAYEIVDPAKEKRMGLGADTIAFFAEKQAEREAELQEQVDVARILQSCLIPFSSLVWRMVTL